MTRMFWLAAGLAAFLILMFSMQHAWADDLPGGITCEQVVRFAADLNIPNTWRGRRQAQLVALALGYVVTSAQLDTAARCLKEAAAR